jgi:hypothetical protein
MGQRIHEKSVYLTTAGSLNVRGMSELVCGLDAALRNEVNTASFFLLDSEDILFSDQARR